MDAFREIDRTSWEREEEYRLFTEVWTTVTYAVTLKIDVTHLVSEMKARGQKLVPVLLWAVTGELNRQENFRMAVKEGKLGVFSGLHPMYAVLNETGNMTFHTTRFQESLVSFITEYEEEAIANAHSRGIFASPMPENSYVISICPFLHFESLSFHLKNAKNYYAPIVDIGRYEEENGKLKMPLSLTVNHAVVDLNHIRIFEEGLQETFDEIERYLPERL